MRSQLLLLSLSAGSVFAGVMKRDDASSSGSRSPVAGRDELCDFEDPNLFSGLADLGVTATPIFEGYCGFHWDFFSAGKRAAVQGLNMNGDGFGIGTDNDGSSLMIQYTGSETKPFHPESVDVGCYLSLMSGPSPAISCSILVVPSNNAEREFNPPNQLCEFNVTSAADDSLIENLTTTAGSVLFNELGIGFGTVQTCNLPQSWRNVDKMTFSLQDSLTPDTSSVLSQLGLNVRAGSAAFAIDDFKYVEA